MSHKQPTLEDLGKDGRSLLLYLETRAVDHGGLVQTQHMNKLDTAMAERWHLDGFIQFGRLPAVEVMKLSTPGLTHYVHFTAHAFKLAHQERRNRAKRMWDERKVAILEL